MDQATFHELCHQASQLAVIAEGRISNLVLTQANDGDEPTIREPEMRHAFCLTLESDRWRLPYGIEVPTKRRYRFVDETGENKTTARHDLVLLADVEGALKRDVLFESKREQPSLVARPGGIDCPAISKDYRKLLMEEGESGKCMFHICHAADRGTLPAVLEKYNAGFTNAHARSLTDAATLGVDLSHNERCWFALYILVVNDRNHANQPFLHSYAAPSLTALLANSAVFQLQHFKKEPVPRP
jgi:hypothetical protein